jgi:ribosome maturation protein Sdo1
MAPVSEIVKADARRIAPPAAHRAERFLAETGNLITEIGQHEKDLQTLLEIRPHDKTEILRLVENLKKKAMTLHGQAVQACQDIKAGR